VKKVCLFKTKDLCHRFPNGVWGLKNICFELFKGEFLILAGPNGSGKTLLLQHLTGLLKPSSGEIVYKDIPLKKQIKKLRAEAAMVFQHPSHQIIEQIVEDDAAFSLRFSSLSEKEINRRVDEALDFMGLSHLRKALTHTLSGGEKKRLALAGVLVVNPGIIFFDEPFTGLDFPGVKDLLKRIVKLKSNGITCCVVTHDISKTLAYADRMVCMFQGNIVLSGIPEECLLEIEKYGIRNPLKKILSVGDCTWLN
jgi:biotin transport system ATP-binding protein